MSTGDELTDDELRELHRAAQEAALKAYPNPERKGCPGRDVLLEMAKVRVPPQHAEYRHVETCSPCLREMLDLQKGELLRQRSLRRVALSGVAATVLIVFGVVGYRTIGQRSGGQGSDTGSLNFVEGGNRAGTAIPQKQQQIGRSTRHLSLLIPMDSGAGPYELEVRDGIDPENRISSYSAVVSEELDGGTILRTDVDLSGLPPGRYVLAWRKRGDATWSHGSVEVR